MSDCVVKVQGLKKRFDEFEALKGIDFDLHPGEVCGFIGPNGAGKTTTMRIMATIDLPSDGEIWVNGHSVIQHPDKVRHALGFMPDQFGEYENLTCDEYLDFYARAYGYKHADRRRRVETVIEFTGLGPIRAKLMSQLSKGMKQRLCLGRTLVHDPHVLVFDEPAAGLDPRARMELRDLIRELAKQGKTILISSHILTELADMCTHVAIIEHGHLKFKGPIGQAHQAATQYARYRLRVLEGIEQLERFILQQAFVKNVAVRGNEITFQYESDERAYSALLAAAMNAGHPIIESRVIENNLEETFLALTTGKAE